MVVDLWAKQTKISQLQFKYRVIMFWKEPWPADHPVDSLERSEIVWQQTR